MEGILASELNYYIMLSIIIIYISQVQEKLKNYLVEVNEMFSDFDNSNIGFFENYKNYTSKEIFFIKNLNN